MFPPVRSAPLWLALTLALPAQAASPDDALRAADPTSPAAALPLPLPTAQSIDRPEPPADLERARAVWREANQRVADFPRGHIDLLRWEAAQPSAAPAAASGSGATALGPAEALRASLRQRPDLFTHAGMNEPARARVRVAYAAHMRDLQQAWIDAVAAHERLRLRDAVLDASRSGSELGQRMVQAGNWPAARLLQEQLVEAAAWQARADAALAAHTALERLAGLMGLWRADAVLALGERLGTGLPALPTRPGDGLADSGIEAAALRADPLLAMEAIPAQRAFAGLPAGRWAAWEATREAALAALPDPAGPATAIATPPHIHDATLLREHRLLEADEHRARLLARASERRAMARSAWAQLQARHAGARHAERVLANLKDAQQQETLLRYNGMFDSTWQLLASARERLDALDAALMARRGYWRAQASWQALLAGADFAMDDLAGAATPAGGNGAGGH